MAKAKKSKSARSKTRKSKASASKARTRAASTAARGRRRGIFPTSIVCVVTPTDPTTQSIAAFCNELINGGQDFILQIYSATNRISNLDTAASLAVQANPAAILACGSMTASTILNHNPQCPVVLVGGEVPPNLSSTQAAKLTGFTIAGIATAKHHRDKLKGHSSDLTVLLDNSNKQSVDIWNQLLPSGVPSQTAQNLSAVQIGANQTMTPLPVSDPGLIQQQTITTKSLMVIPNAMYYMHSADIAAMVDASPAVKWVYYPEREYQKASHNTNHNVQVFGHNIPGTFQDAADIVNGVLNGTYSLTPGQPPGSQALPTITGGRTEQDPGS